MCVVTDLRCQVVFAPSHYVLKCNKDNKIKITFEKLHFKWAEGKLYFSYTSPQVTEMKSHVTDWQTLNKEQRFVYFWDHYFTE